MVLSIDIPNEMLKISAVLGFSGMLNNPMIPAVISMGIIFGTSEIAIIFMLAKMSAIMIEIKIKATIKLSVRSLIRYWFPFKNRRVVPVVFTFMSVPLNISVDR